MSWQQEVLAEVMNSVGRIAGSDCALWLSRHSTRHGYPILLRGDARYGPKVINVVQFMHQWADDDWTRVSGIPLFKNTCGVTGAVCVNPSHSELVEWESLR